MAAGADAPAASWWCSPATSPTRCCGAARLLPQPLRVLAKRRGAGAAERDVFPAVYRANTLDALDATLARVRVLTGELCTVATLHRYAGEHRGRRRR